MRITVLRSRWWDSASSSSSPAMWGLERHRSGLARTALGNSWRRRPNDSSLLRALPPPPNELIVREQRRALRSASAFYSSGREGQCP
jgi:hypothetical protein